MKKRNSLEGPYDQCINCKMLGVECDGPNFLAMSTERWCSWCKRRKNLLNISNEDLAEQADVSVTTIERIMAGLQGDIRVSTMQNVTKVLINGSWGEHPCANPEQTNYQIEAQALRAELDKVSFSHKELRNTLDEVIKSCDREVENIRSDSEKKIAYLKNLAESREKLFKRMLFILIALIILLSSAVLIDIFSNNIGWLR